jgi:hypothetical protein
MTRINRLLGAGAAVALAAGIGWQALAQAPEPGGPPGFGMGRGMMMGMHGGFGPMSGALADPAARLAALKDRLGITAAQAPAWDAYAKAVQDAHAAMRAAFQGVDPTAWRSQSFDEQQALMKKMFDARQTAAKDVHDAALALLPALDERQKGRAEEILPGLAPMGPGMIHAGFGGRMGPMGGPPWR